LILLALGIILHENATTTKEEDHPMWKQEFTWFFALFHQEFRDVQDVTARPWRTSIMSHSPPEGRYVHVLIEELAASWL
jgi:hypothetical protein